jgi:SAM-dependent methyltransferase
MAVLVRIEDLYTYWDGAKVKDTIVYKTALMMAGNPDLDVMKTMYCAWLQAQLKANGDVWGYIKTPQDVALRCLKFRELFREIRDKGLLCPINVYVKGNGDIKILDGTHRAVIFAVLGYTYIPAVVGMQKVKWREMMRPDQVRGYDDDWARLLDLLKKEAPGMLYAEVDHPFFDGMSIWRQSKPRFEAIASHIGLRDRVIDIGCFTGYFVHHLRMMGVKADGVDVKKDAIEAARMLNKVYHVDPEFYEADALALLTQERDYNIGLLLSTVHHMERAKGPQYVKDLLRITPDTMFIEVVRSGEEMAKTLDINADTFLAWMHRHTDYKQFEVIHKDLHQQRPMFLCRRF